MTHIWQIWVGISMHPLEGDQELTTCAGSILVAFIAIIVSGLLLWRSERKKAAVGRRWVHTIHIYTNGNER